VAKRRVFASEEERKEAYREYSRQYRARNKEACRARDRARYYADHEASKKRQREKAAYRQNILVEPSTMLSKERALKFSRFVSGDRITEKPELEAAWEAHESWLERIDLQMYLRDGRAWSNVI
jgi:hypothetical protein